MEYPDIYFDPGYAKLYETEDSSAVEYVFKSEYGTITNLFLKRKINMMLSDQIQYYDIITPYGYGGPVIHDYSDKIKLLAAYMEDFKKYADEEHIVSEFIRFHPIIGNGVDFQKEYQSIYDRKTIGTNLTYEDVIAAEFSKHKRKEIRKILENPDIHYKIDEAPESLADFIECYYDTMERDRADSYYYFDISYFEKMLKTFPRNIITGKVFLGDTLIAMGIYFRYNNFLHAHLSGTKTAYLSYSPAAILKYALAIYGHEHGYSYIHYGGGSTNSPDNGLFKYKKEFGKNTEFDFYIAKKIWNTGKYEEMCAAKGVDSNTDFFPAYRQKNI